MREQQALALQRPDELQELAIAPWLPRLGRQARGIAARRANEAAQVLHIGLSSLLVSGLFLWLLGGVRGLGSAQCSVLSAN